MNKIKISIITPAFNPGSFISETYNSLEEQSFKDFEWIIVDDNSDRKNKEYFDEIKAKAKFPVVIVTNRISLRQAKSKNIGLKYAQGKYLKFLDADDLLDCNHLENQYELLEKNEEINCAVFSPTKNFWVVNGTMKEQVNISYKTVPEDNLEQLKRFLVFPFFHHCGCLFLKNDLTKIGGFDESLSTDEDGDFILRLMLEGILFKKEERSYYLYRHHSGIRVSNDDSEEKWCDRMKVCLKMQSSLRLKGIDLKEQVAQRLDILGTRSFYHCKARSKKFFQSAEEICPNYFYPGNKVTVGLRKLLGTSNYLNLKSLLIR